jgi:Flp pilus assembly protein TadD
VHLLEIARTSGDGADFQQILQTALSRYPEDETFALHRANQLFGAQKYHDLIEQLGSIESPSAAMQTLLAASYQRIGQHREAAQHYIEALKQDPRQPRNWISLGISQQHLGDREQALHAFRMAPRSGSLNQRLHDFVQARIQQLSNPD